MAVERIPIHRDTYYVYAVLCQDEQGPGYIKFGHSKNVGSRLTALRTGCPIPARYFATSPVGRSKALTLRLERAFHERFADRHASGEWFRFDFKDEADKREFNDGCREAFQSILGGRYEWWTKVSVSALDAYARERQTKFLRSAHKSEIQRRAERKRAGKRAQKELASYGDTS